LAARPLVVGIDGRELAGSPTGTGRYLRNLLRHWRETGDELFVYFNGPPALDPVVAIFEARTMTEYLGMMRYPYRVAASLATLLAGFALVLAGVGLYGVLACGIAERLRELAIRIALGAAPGSIVRAAAAGTVRATLIGTLGGAGLALVVGRLLAGVLFGISGSDPAALAVTAGIVVAVVAGSSFAPVRRVLRVAPMSILRL